MYSKLTISGCIAVLMAATAPSAFATTIASDYTKITTSGDYRDVTKPGQSYDYTIDLSGFNYTNASNVELEITAKGDYGSYNITKDSSHLSTTPYEWFTFKLDDITFANMWGNTTGLNVDYTPGFSAISGPSVTLTPDTHDDFVMTAKFSLSDSLFQALAADGFINVSWQNGSEVDPYHSSEWKDGGYHDGGEDGVSWALSANVSPVPVPAAVWMFAPALMGFASLRRKSTQAKA